uniref:RNA-dependent RNA polymerase n=1 Tax=Triatoma infestans TaxID=30076 RepID=A0A161MPF0_TRIIF
MEERCGRPGERGHHLLQVQHRSPHLGAPKETRLSRVVEETLPLIVNAIKDGTLDELYRKQPELFLVELKNKTDRYEDPLAKTRPYVCVPAHWGLLFSVLSQGISEALYTFDQGKGGVNAYGFSAAHGGISRLAAWALETPVGESRTAHYGDDTDMYYRDRDGRCSGVPPTSPKWTAPSTTTHPHYIKWILAKYKLAWPDTVGEEHFWAAVGKEWLRQATQADLIVNGTKIWRKKQKDGLLSGVIGTTLFDTVKGAVAFDHFRTAMRAKPTLWQEDKAIKYFGKLGLEIKAGTWQPETVNLSEAADTLWTNQKFLGVHYMYKPGANRMGMVPWLPHEEWVKNLLCSRSDPDASRNDVRLAGRLRFDRLRGLMITGGFSNRESCKLLESMLAYIPARDILMEVQADEGRGEQPEFGLISGEDFHWPTSQGWPTPAWCTDLYMAEDNKTNVVWAPVFPTLEDDLTQLRSVDRTMKPVLRQVADVTNRVTRRGPDQVLASILVEEPEPEEEPREAPELLPIGGKPLAKHDSFNEKPTNCDLEGRPVPRLTIGARITQMLRRKAPVPLVPPRREHWRLYEQGVWKESDMPVHAKASLSSTPGLTQLTPWTKPPRMAGQSMS